MSSTSSVAAMASTPSLNAASRSVPRDRRPRGVSWSADMAAVSGHSLIGVVSRKPDLTRPDGDHPYRVIATRDTRGKIESSAGGEGLSRRSPQTCGAALRGCWGPEGRPAMSIGPVEYVLLGFPGNNFTGQIVPELAKLIDSGLVRIIDLTFISKDAAGRVEVVEYDAVEELAAFAGLDAEVGGILTDEDVAHAALSLEPNTSAALLIWEDTWATPFAEAVRNANGVILEGARIPREIIEEVMEALADAVD